MHALLVEDDGRTRARLAGALAAHGQLKSVATAESCAAARIELRARQPGLLLVDLGLPDGDGTELIEEARAANPATLAMVITVFGDEEHVVRAIRAGATGYLLKDASDSEIGRSITALLAGGSPISPAVASYLLKHMRPAPPAPVGAGHARDARNRAQGALLQQQPLVEELSPRELEVLQLVADGSSYAEIGQKLFISVNTVGTHIKHIYDKLAVKSRGKAVREASRLGLLAGPLPGSRS